MPRTLTASLAAASALLLTGCVAEDEPPAPSLADQLRATGSSSDAGDPVAHDDATAVPEGEQVVVGDVAIEVSAVEAGSQASVSIDTPDEAADEVELAVGQTVEVGGYQVTLAEAEDQVAQVVVHGPDGTQL